MTDRRAPTSTEVVTTALAQLDSAYDELARLYSHVSWITPDNPGQAFAAARSAAIVAGVTGQVADQLRSLACRQASSTISSSTS